MAISQSTTITSPPELTRLLNLLACPEYGKMWVRQSNLLDHLKDHQVHQDNDATKTRLGRRSQALASRYETSMDDLLRNAPDSSLLSRNGTTHIILRTRNGVLVRMFKHFDFHKEVQYYICCILPTHRSQYHGRGTTTEVEALLQYNKID